MQGVILAAGGGTRLGPLTRDRSKAMLPVLGKPMVERIMEDLASCGIRDFVLVVAPQDSDIVPYFRDRSGLDSRVEFVTQPEPLGMADALSYALPRIAGDFVLSACDNLVERAHVQRMVDVWRETPSPDAVLVVAPFPPEKVSASGIVAMDGCWITRIVEKPALEDAPSNIASLPLYCFSGSFLPYLSEVEVSERGERELQDAIQAMIDRGGRVRALTVPGRLTLTAPSDLLAINMHYLARGDDPSGQPSPPAGPNTKLVGPIHVEQDLRIGADCEIGPSVYLEHGCRIGDSVTLRNSVVLRSSVIADGEMVEDKLISGPEIFPAHQ